MKKISTLFLLAAGAFSLNVNAQCTETIINDAGNFKPAYILDSDTSMNSSETYASWLICSGVEVVFRDNSSFNSFYIEPGGKLEFDSSFSYGYSKVYAKSGALFDGNNRQYDTLFYETGAMLEDTTVFGQFGDNINCSSMTFIYTQLPGGVGCASSAVNENNFSAQINVYPNPADNKVKIEWKQSVENAKIILFDARGLAVMNLNAGNFGVDMDVSALPGGLYFIDISIEGQRYLQKIIVK